MRPLAALILREWRTSWADRSAYVLRAGYAGVLLLGAIGAWILLPLAQSGRAEELPGLVRSIFAIFCKGQFFVAMLLASMTFARALSREQERGSLDLLLLSPLTRTELLLGKLIGEFLGLAALIACGIPVLFLLLPLGGLTPLQILSVQLLLLAELLLVGGICVGLSAVLEKALSVMACAWVLMGGFVFGPMAYDGWMALKDWRWQLWHRVSPYALLEEQLDSVRPQWKPACWALGAAALIGILACGLGSLVLERRVVRGKTLSLWVRWGRPLRRFAETVRGRWLFRTMTTLEHPLMRREFAVYRDLPFRISWFLLVVGYAAEAVRIFNDPQSREENQVMLAGGGLLLGAVIAVLTGALSTGYDRLRGRLQTLLAAGVSPEDIVRSRMAGLLMRMLHLLAIPVFHLTVIAFAAGWCPRGEWVWRIPATIIAVVLAAEAMTGLTLRTSLSIPRPEVAAVVAVTAALPIGALVIGIVGGALPGFALGAPLIIALALSNYARCVRNVPRWVLR